MVPVRHFLMLYRVFLDGLYALLLHVTLLDSWRTPFIAVIQGVLGWSLYVTFAVIHDVIG